MSKFITYTYRIYPNKSQEALINDTFEACRIVYNTLLTSRKSIYRCFSKYRNVCEESGIIIDKSNFNKLNKEPSIPKIKEKFPLLKDVDSLALCAEWNNLNKAFSNFNSKTNKFPKYKNRKDKNTYITSIVNNNIRIENSKIRLPKIGFVKIKLHRELPEYFEIKRVIVKIDKCGKYYVAIVLKNTTKNKKVNEISKVVGLDFKIGNLFVSSDNQIPDPCMPYKLYFQKLKKIEKSLNSKQKFSKNWHKNLKKIRKLYIKISNKRTYFLHNISKNIAENYDLVGVEDLSLIKISQNLNKGTNVYDTAYYSFLEKLKYKLDNQGKEIKKVDKWFPSSKKCSNCDNIKHIFSLSSKVYFCHKCHITIDRDLNAAQNIKKETIKKITNK